MFDKSVLDLSPLRKEAESLLRYLKIVEEVRKICEGLDGMGREGFGELKWFYDVLVEHPELKHLIGIYLDSNGVSGYTGENIFKKLERSLSGLYWLKGYLQLEEPSFPSRENLLREYIAKENEIKVVNFLQNEILPSLTNFLPIQNPQVFFIISLNTSTEFLVSQYPWIKELSEDEQKKFVHEFKIKFVTQSVKKDEYRPYYCVRAVREEELNRITFHEAISKKGIYVRSGLSESIGYLSTEIFGVLLELSESPFTDEYSSVKILAPIKEKTLDFYANAINQFAKNERKEYLFDFIKNSPESLLGKVREGDENEVRDFLFWIGFLKVDKTKIPYFNEWGQHEHRYRTFCLTRMGEEILSRLKAKIG